MNDILGIQPTCEAADIMLYDNMTREQLQQLCSNIERNIDPQQVGQFFLNLAILYQKTRDFIPQDKRGEIDNLCSSGRNALSNENYHKLQKITNVLYSEIIPYISLQQEEQ